MEIVYDDDDLKTYVAKAALVSGDHPILIDDFLEDAYEFDVDAICDGENVFIAGIMQHFEEAGIHSGDSASVLPAFSLTDDMVVEIKQATQAIAKQLHVIGLLNIQYAIYFINEYIVLN